METKSPAEQRIADLLLQLGKAYVDCGQYEEAIDYFRKLIELNGENETLYTHLSTALIHQGKCDDEAYKIYRKTLNYFPDNYHDLMMALIQMDYRRGKYKILSSLSEDDILPFFDDPRIIPQYAQLGWKQEAYDQVSNALKLILGKKFHMLALKFLMLNFVKIVKSARKEVRFSYEDLQYCDNYLKSVRQFERLNEIYLYLILKKIILTSYEEKMLEQKQNISEYEFFLDNNFLSNVWDKALNRKVLIDRQFHFSREIWYRVRALSDGADSESNGKNRQDPVNDFSRMETALILQIDDIDQLIERSDAIELFTAFDKTLHEAFDASSVSRFKRVDDGYLLFGKDVVSIVAGATGLMSKFRKFTFHIAVHSRRGQSEIELLDDLIALFEIQQNGPDTGNGGHSGDAAVHHQIRVSESASGPLREHGFDAIPLKPIAIPFSGVPLNIYEIPWQHPLDILRTGGDVKVGRFRILEEMGDGEQFVTFKALDTFLERVVILKVLKNVKDVLLYLNNAKSIGKINHDGIAVIYDIGEAGGFAYYAREFIEGISFSDWMKSRDIADWSGALSFIQHVGRALGYAHQAGLIHGALKPANLFLAGPDEVKVSDFSIPGMLLPMKQKTTTDLRRISYMAPEQIETGEVTVRTDLHALGVLLYEALTGVNPFYAEDRWELLRRIKSLQPLPPASLNSSCPASLNAILFKVLAKSPQDRNTSVEQFLQDLKRI